MSGLGVFRVTLTTRNTRTHEPIFVNFECAHPTLISLANALNDGRLVHGEALHSRRISDNRFEITGRHHFVLGRAGVAHIETPPIQFEEADHG